MRYHKCLICDTQIPATYLFCERCFPNDVFIVNSLNKASTPVVIGIELEHSEVSLENMIRLIWKFSDLKRFVHEIKTDGSIPNGSEITLLPSPPKLAYKRLLQFSKMLYTETPKPKSPSAIHFHIMFPKMVDFDELLRWHWLSLIAFEPFERLRLATNSSLKHYRANTNKRATTIRSCMKGGYLNFEFRVFPANYNPKITSCYYKIVMWVYKQFCRPGITKEKFQEELDKRINVAINLWNKEGGCQDV